MSLKDFDLAKLMEENYVFSVFALGDGPRFEGVLADARSALEMIEQAPRDLMAWADLALITMEGAQRQGFDAIEVVAAIIAAQAMKAQRSGDVINYTAQAITQPTQEG